jgi:hypothetical protein
MDFVDVLHPAVETMQAKLEGHVLFHSGRDLGKPS